MRQSIGLNNDKKALGDSFIKAANHWITYGEKEERRGAADEIREIKTDEKELLKYVKSYGIPKIKIYPKVSIIIVNRNGIEHLKNLANSIYENTFYPYFELIFVDNNSDDNSKEFINTAFKNPVLIENNFNESFSKANNQGAEKATGELLLFLNNDIIPLYGWLPRMVYTYFKYGKETVGSVGSKLIYPEQHQTLPLRIQHRGISFSLSKDFIRPINIGTGDNPFYDDDPGVERIANTAACLMIDRNKFTEVGGFDESYIYGYEDVDLGLKLIKRGYKNIFCKESILYHNEFGTQTQNTTDELRNRRLNNIAVLKKKWGDYIKQNYWDSILDNKKDMFSFHPLHVAIIVSEDNPETTLGDYFTATELKLSMEKIEWHVTLIPRTGGNNWHVIPNNVQVVINLLDEWNPLAVISENKSLIKIAWARNWFDKWAKHPGFADYDIIITSSKNAIPLLQKHTSSPIYFMPIATNPERFLKGEKKGKYSSDYCFTGSYWGHPREIIDFLNPQKLGKYKGKIFGENWDKFEKFKEINHGFIPYEDIKDVYASTKLLIDDANTVTKPWGSVNSRVFDALGKGVLVITNGDIGSREIFNGLLPVYHSEESLTKLIDEYLSDEKKRKYLVKKLQTIVLENHTYDNRIKFIKSILKKRSAQKSLVIKIPAPNWDVAEEWGDYHLALGLKKSFEKQDIKVKLQVLNEWNDTTDIDYDYVLVLRGLSKYNPKSHHLNLMWNISHPDKIAIEEYNLYDHVFVASDYYAHLLSQNIDSPVSALLQCTSTELFFPPEESVKNELLFVGNSRKKYRKILKDLIPTDRNLSVYGTNWKGLIPDKYIKGEHIKNNELNKYYAGASVLLNDHWDSMRENGFISNRIFDGLACGAIILSDSVKGLKLYQS
ncbi:MAG: glycosyltransferase [Bacteroidia bacterium]|nr:glycosyltransferase [Bacteroidia bacterium]